jgi:hypothetical protein
MPFFPTCERDIFLDVNSKGAKPPSHRFRTIELPFILGRLADRPGWGLPLTTDQQKSQFAFTASDTSTDCSILERLQSLF